MGQWQLNRKHRARALLTLDADRPAMIFDDAVTDRQPEAGPFPDVFGRKKRIEQSRLDIGRDPTPVSRTIISATVSRLRVVTIMDLWVFDSMASRAFAMRLINTCSS